MIRIRIKKTTCPEWLEQEGFKEVTPGIWTKQYGTLEVSVKLGYPSNLRVKDWSDNRAPWILFRFMLGMEAGEGHGGKIKVTDEGHWRILNIQDTIDMICDLCKFTDLRKRLEKWYTEYIEGKLKL